MKNHHQAWCVAIATCIPLLAAAQAATTGAQMAAPQLSYQSAFADYKAYKDVPLANWRKVNETVAGAPGGSGGHIGHGMGPASGMATPSAPPVAASAPRPTTSEMPTHGGHRQPGGKP